MRARVCAHACVECDVRHVAKHVCARPHATSQHTPHTMRTRHALRNRPQLPLGCGSRAGGRLYPAGQHVCSSSARAAGGARQAGAGAGAVQRGAGAGCSRGARNCRRARCVVLVGPSALCGPELGHRVGPRVGPHSKPGNGSVWHAAWLLSNCPGPGTPTPVTCPRNPAWNQLTATATQSRRTAAAAAAAATWSWLCAAGGVAQRCRPWVPTCWASWVGGWQTTLHSRCA